MSYLSLARKYRPKTFDEIVGQEHIATTLKNAIALERVGHAYLFTGPRGVGKTSTARILAKSLNCEKGPTSQPCAKCVACTEITQGISMDVIEIDGASNRGIDEVRNLRENVKFSPARGKYKIYIIDEVHMLTEPAFNALLKTLEEPPAHVKFIFATTRPDKVLPTILSRCQRFDFKKISPTEIVNKLNEIKKEEKLDLAEETVSLVAKASDGSLRDAEVILEQLLSSTKGKVTPQDVTSVLGLLEQDALFSITDHIINNSKEKILDTLNTLINNGKDPIFIATGIISHMRNLMVAKVSRGEGRLFVGLPEEDYKRLIEQGEDFSLDEILYITYTLSNTVDLIKKTSLGRVPLEVALLKLTERARLISIQEILDRVSSIEKKLGGVNSEYEEPFAGQASEKALPQPQEPPKKILKLPKEEISAEEDILLLQNIKLSWNKILNLVKTRKMSIASYVSEGTLLRVKADTLSIGFKKENSLHKETVSDTANKKIVEEAIKNVIGKEVFLSFETISEEFQPEVQTVAGLPDTANEANDIPRTAASGTTGNIEPIVESALDIFDGRVVDIRHGKRKESQ